MPQTSQVQQVGPPQSMLPQIAQLLGMIPGPQQPFVQAAGALAGGNLAGAAQAATQKGQQQQPQPQAPQPPAPMPQVTPGEAPGQQSGDALKQAQIQNILAQSPAQQGFQVPQAQQGQGGFDKQQYQAMQNLGSHLGGIYGIASQMGWVPSLLSPFMGGQGSSGGGMT